MNALHILLQVSLFGVLLVAGNGLSPTRSGPGAPVEMPESSESLELKRAFENKLYQLHDVTYFSRRLDNLESLESEEADLWLSEINRVLYLQYQLDRVSFPGAERSLREVLRKYPDHGAYARNYLSELEKWEGKIEQLKPRIYKNRTAAIEETEEFLKSFRKTFLRNPVLENLNIYAIRQVIPDARKANAAQIGRNQNNWTVNASMRRSGWDNEICRLSNLKDQVEVTSVFRPDHEAPIKDMDLHWSGEKMLFSSVGDHRRWHVYEMDTRTGEVNRLTQADFKDLDYFDACYLPNGKIVLSSTASYAGVPCVGGSEPTSDLYLLDPATDSLRQLSFGQDCNWNPVVMNDGKVGYLRWEYTDNSHYFTRILMHMNPDGTTKKELYGSGSYFPNALFDSRPIPGKSKEFIGIVSGHHGTPRSGRLMIFDPEKGRKEADGVVQEIPGYGKKVKPIIRDRLVDGIWPQFLTPYPVDENHFLVTAKPGPDALWGIYLVDRFDNMVLVHQAEGVAFTEPFIDRKQAEPPVIPERVLSGEETSTVYITDIYEGKGLKGIPRGTVKKLRIYAYQYGYNKEGGHDLVAFEGGWDVKRILGTVPVEPDGSAMFTIPANTPISLQPLDQEGAALQLMRSWMTGMPGEVVSCVGCHESQNSAPPVRFTMASRKHPAGIVPWYGPARPVAYNTELKPVIDRKCVGCHNGKKDGIPDFSSDRKAGYKQFSESYMALHPYVRRPGCESDFHTLEPMDYHVNTSELVQMLKKGHHGVELEPEEWDRLITWIDMNVPFLGKYRPPQYNGFHQPDRRDKFSRMFGNVYLTGEQEYEEALKQLKERKRVKPEMPDRKWDRKKSISLEGWPLHREKALQLQQQYAVDGELTRTVELTEEISLEFVRIPAGTFVFGNIDGQPDQQERIVEIKQPFWMSKTEVTNAQFRVIFGDHHSRFIDQQWKDHIFAGYPANEDQMPVIRMTWGRAHAYCKILSDRTGLDIKLPTEEQWEWAARAGSGTDMYYGEAGEDFSAYENLADYTLRDLAVIGVDPRPMGPENPRFKFYNFVPKDERFNDGVLTPQGTGQFEPNAWGLFDMLGNVSEWTRSDYDFYGDEQEYKVVRGGSWRDRPEYATAATRDGYRPYQKIYNVGLRLVIED